MSKVPPNISDGVFAVSGSSIIDAPVDTVWHVLLDLDGYKEWNPFVRGQKVTDRAGNPIAHSVAEGQYMSIYPVHLPPTLDDSIPFYKKSSAFVVCTCLDNDNHRIAWRTAGALPTWLLNAERWQMLTVRTDGHVKYESVEVFKGPIAYLVKFFVGKSLKLGVDAMAEGLKIKSESSQARK